MIHVILPYHLRTLAGVKAEVSLEVAAPVTIRSVLDTLETVYPMLQGTIRDHDTLQRRPFLRYFACGEDWSSEPEDLPLPPAVIAGQEPVTIIGAIAGG
jgi:hypothetical protein